MLVVANARHSTTYGCALLLGHARKTLSHGAPRGTIVVADSAVLSRSMLVFVKLSCRAVIDWVDGQSPRNSQGLDRPSTRRVQPTLLHGRRVGCSNSRNQLVQAAPNTSHATNAPLFCRSFGSSASAGFRLQSFCREASRCDQGSCCAAQPCRRSAWHRGHCGIHHHIPLVGRLLVHHVE